MLVEEKNFPKRQLQRECKSLSDRLLWDAPLDRDTIYRYRLPSGWMAFLTTRYHGAAVETIRALPTVDRFFYQSKVNRFKQLNIWCVRGELAEELTARLKTLPETRLQPLADYAHP